MKRILIFIFIVGLAVLFSLPVSARRNDTMFTSDDSTGAISTVAWPHQRIHNGTSYLAGTSGVLADAATIKISFRTPITATVHMTFMAECSGEANLAFYENPTVTVSTGTQLPIFNRNRLSSNTCTLSEATNGEYIVGNLAKDATLSGGTAIFPEFHFGSGKKIGGGGTFSDEFILAMNEDYALVVTSESADNHCSVQINHYGN